MLLDGLAHRARHDLAGEARRSTSHLVWVMRYVPTAPGVGPRASAADRHWLELACELATQCPPSRSR